MLAAIHQHVFSLGIPELLQINPAGRKRSEQVMPHMKNWPFIYSNASRE